MNQPLISRRDWFRLRLASDSADSRPARDGVSAETTPLQPVPAPPEHDGMGLSQLPPMREALLDELQLDQLLGDIHALGENVLLMHRDSGQTRRWDGSLPLSEQLAAAGSGLRTGQLQRLQIRYQWEGADWIDTLERRDQSFRLARIRHVSGRPGAGD